MHTRYSEERASFWLEVWADMFRSWQTACGYNANIPMGKVSRGVEITIERVESLARKIGRVKNERESIKQESSQEMKDPPGIAAGEAGSGARNTN